MKKPLYLLILGAIAGTVIAVVVANAGMDEGTNTYKKFDSSV